MISDGYRSILEQIHSTEQWGLSASLMIDTIEAWVRSTGVNRVLDYGAGAGFVKNKLPRRIPGLEVISYEPGIPAQAALPDPAPLVLCIDVLEHVEPEYVEDVLDDLKRVVERYAFFNVATHPARRILPDGRNAHLTVQPMSWWAEKILARWPDAKQIEDSFRIGLG